MGENIVDQYLDKHLNQLFSQSAQIEKAKAKHQPERENTMTRSIFQYTLILLQLIKQI